MSKSFKKMLCFEQQKIKPDSAFVDILAISFGAELESAMASTPVLKFKIWL